MQSSASYCQGMSGEPYPALPFSWHGPLSLFVRTFPLLSANYRCFIGSKKRLWVHQTINGNTQFLWLTGDEWKLTHRSVYE